jgi:hypothetical protein
VLLDPGEDREAHRLLRAVAVLGVVPVGGRRGQDDGTVGGERLFQSSELEDVGMTHAQGEDDPRSAELVETHRAPVLTADEGIGGQSGGGGSGGHERHVKEPKAGPARGHRRIE